MNQRCGKNRAVVLLGILALGFLGASSLPDFKPGDAIEALDYLNARNTPSFTKNWENVAHQIPPSALCSILEVKPLNFGVALRVRIELSDTVSQYYGGPKEFWVYYNPSKQNMLLLKANKNQNPIQAAVTKSPQDATHIKTTKPTTAFTQVQLKPSVVRSDLDLASGIACLQDMEKTLYAEPGHYYPKGYSAVAYKDPITKKDGALVFTEKDAYVVTGAKANPRGQFEEFFTDSNKIDDSLKKARTSLDPKTRKWLNDRVMDVMNSGFEAVQYLGTPGQSNPLVDKWLAALGTCSKVQGEDSIVKSATQFSSDIRSRIAAPVSVPSDPQGGGTVLPAP